MKKLKIASLIFSLSLGLFLFSNQVVHAEVIRDFNSVITISSDSPLTVTEKITYDFEGAERHGIFRVLLLRNAKNEKMRIDVLKVSDEAGQTYPFSTSHSNDTLTVRIGDPDKFVRGVKIYIITYKAEGAIGFYDTYDEIYWNVTGKDWPVIIQKASATVILPEGTTPLQGACYEGDVRSTTPCAQKSYTSFVTNSSLAPREQLTIATGFPKGIVTAPVIVERTSSLPPFIQKFWPLFFILIPVGVFIVMFRMWRKKGRDPKGRAVIIPQYDVPDALTPLEVGGIVNQKIEDKNISAEIVYLATKGYIKIIQTNEKVLGLINNKDYTLVLLKDATTLSNAFDQKIIKALFKGGTSVVLSDLKYSFYKSIKGIKKKGIESLLSKGYYKNLPSSVPASLVILQVVTSLLFIAGIVFVVSQSDFLRTSFVATASIVGGSIVSTIIIYYIFQKLLPAKTEKGVAAKEYLLGLKDYLQIAEKDRLHFHNAPEKKPEVFEMLLPYAMIFGVEKLWAKEFEGIYTVPPTWYEGPVGSFSALALTKDLQSFGGFMYTAAATGGSTGGGFAGGGGGGGGGGSW